MKFPAPVPEIAVADLDKAIAYYVNVLGFGSDWRSEKDGIAGISRDDCRLFIASQSLRQLYGKMCPGLMWLNLSSRAEVDELCAEWKAAGAKIVCEPADKPWKLREFTAMDPDGNLIRVFYDFNWEESKNEG